LVEKTAVLTVEACVRLAEECEQDADRASTPKIREEMRETARMWRDLAEFKRRMLRSRLSIDGNSTRKPHGI
jgi:hypothetical protein